MLPILRVLHLKQELACIVPRRDLNLLLQDDLSHLVVQIQRPDCPEGVSQPLGTKLLQRLLRPRELHAIDHARRPLAVVVCDLVQRHRHPEGGRLRQLRRAPRLHEFPRLRLQRLLVQSHRRLLEFHAAVGVPPVAPALQVPQPLVPLGRHPRQRLLLGARHVGPALPRQPEDRGGALLQRSYRHEARTAIKLQHHRALVGIDEDLLELAANQELDEAFHPDLPLGFGGAGGMGVAALLPQALVHVGPGRLPVVSEERGQHGWGPPKPPARANMA
mmetsp:Transcript_91545/g.267892  ORF Transcript_91545/g.267892 Transcript_91545/m.267892 type:complete len:275 (+) Transcript_91545:1253-2077(+)